MFGIASLQAGAAAHLPPMGLFFLFLNLCIRKVFLMRRLLQL
jgi:hypothetical protein